MHTCSVWGTSQFGKSPVKQKLKLVVVVVHVASLIMLTVSKPCL